jgi:hypothetical protein
MVVLDAVKLDRAVLLTGDPCNQSQCARRYLGSLGSQATINFCLELGNSCRDVQIPRHGVIDLPMVFLWPVVCLGSKGPMEMNYVATSYVAAHHLYTTAKTEEN